MQRGVDAVQFSPSRREPGVRPFTIGYVGRLSVEKNVRFLADVERTLQEAGKTDFRFLIAGSGGEQDWLSANLSHAEMLGVVKGEALAQAYANMDVFAFPSHTDTFGNVILEALASGVPAVVTTGGGPKFLVKSGVTGFIASDDRTFSHCILDLMNHPSSIVG
ncbi:MAG: glycosyltransferase [Bryobacteraceae bacterium]